MIKTCINPNCKKEFNSRRSIIKYCSVACSNQHKADKIKTALSGLKGPVTDAAPELFPKPAPVAEVKKEKTKVVMDDVPARTKTTLMPPGNMDLQTQFVFTMLNKEVDRFEDAAKEQKQKAEKLLAENEKLREELAQLKTDQRIAEIESEHAKPGGLQGFTQSLSGLLDNQFIGPVIADTIRGFMGGGMRALATQPGADQLSETVVEVLQWFSAQDATVQASFQQLVKALNAVQDKTRIPDLITRLVNIVSNGSTIVRSGSTNASMSYGT